MRQVVQGVGGGGVRLVEAPRPVIGPTQVLVATSVSVLSAGTERAVRELAGGGLLAKARARPDLVRQMVAKARTDGLAPTVRAVRSRLDDDLPLGYSAAGVVVEVGEAVAGVRPGQRVATGGAGHGELQVVAGHLAVPIPEAVGDEEGALATLASVALHGLRLAELGPGSKVCVVGLGLLGQLAVRLAQAAGHDVAGIDVRPWPVERAREVGTSAWVDEGEATTQAVLEWSRGRGADAVLLTAATASSAPARRAPSLARDRATIVVVGDVGLELTRRPFYDKELTLRFSRSYGPGRYELAYEGWGVDYPAGQVRWTEGRNLEAYLDLVATGRLTVADLVTHRFPLDQVTQAYQLLEQASEPFLAVLVTYGAPRPSPPPPPARVRAARRTQGVGLIGAGTFARATLVPALGQAGFSELVSVTSATGRSAARLAAQAGFDRVGDDARSVIEDPEVSLVVVATPHDTHAALVVAALEAGKAVFCEKPVALSEDELDSVATAWRANPVPLMVGFNRRHSPAIAALRAHLGGSGGPLVLTYRVSAGRLPSAHWYHDRRQGGRLLGEVCHFVDTCNAVVASPVSVVHASGSGQGELALDQDVVVTLSYADGSLATITYASGGHPRTAKERLEVLGRGHSALVDDYRRVVLDEQPVKGAGQDKGHRAEMAVLRQALSGDDHGLETASALASTSATLAALASLTTGRPVAPTAV